MNYSLVEQVGSGATTKRQRDFPSNEEVSVQELSRAVGQHALLQAEIDPSDVLDADNHAVLNLPEFRPVQVAVFADGASQFATDLLAALR